MSEANQMSIDLPKFKPPVMMMVRTAANGFVKPPFVMADRVVINYFVPEGQGVSQEDLRSWTCGLHRGPALWYYVTIAIRDSDNKSLLKGVFKGDNIPPEIAELYSFFWQLRMAIGHFSVDKKIKAAEYAYYWYLHFKSEES